MASVAFDHRRGARSRTRRDHPEAAGGRRCGSGRHGVAHHAEAGLDRETPRDLALHLIADNDATPKHPKVRARLDKHPRFTMRFTPTSSSWLNLVERFFAGLTGDVIRAGSFAAVNDLVRDINTDLAKRNADPKPYRWRTTGADILAKSNRARAIPDNPQAA